MERKEYVKETVIINHAQQASLWSPGVAAVLSLVIPGAGQMYKGNVGTGILWLIFTTIGYLLLIVPGVILHIICIVTAASGNPNAPIPNQHPVKERITETVTENAQTKNEDKTNSHQDKVTQLQKLKKLFDEGILTQQEFDEQKTKILNK